MMFKELELKVQKDRYVNSVKAVWNGGDGIDWTIERVKCYNHFAKKHLTGFLAGTEAPPAPIQFRFTLLSFHCASADFRILHVSIISFQSSSSSSLLREI